MTVTNREIKLPAIDPEIIRSIYRRKHRDRDRLNTKLFLEFDEEHRNLLSNSISLRDNEELAIVSWINRSQWIALSNYGVYAYQDNACDRVDYIDIIECSNGIDRLWERGIKAFIENKDIEITTTAGDYYLLTVADFSGVNQTLVDIIIWSSGRCKAT